jgi:methionyl-tRNA formyltransferase
VKIIFMGTPEFACPALKVLASSPHTVQLVVTGMDSRARRGQETTPTPVKKTAELLGLPVMTVDSPKSSVLAERVQELSPDLIVVIAFKVLPQSLYSIPRLGAMNVHASLLPKYRGAAPINHAIMNGETETGLTAFLLQPSVDTGDVVSQQKVTIGEDETFGELYNRLSTLSGPFLIGALEKVLTGDAGLRQDESKATRAPKIFPADTYIQFTHSAERVRNFVRGLSPHPGATTEYRGSIIKILVCVHVADSRRESDLPGTLVVHKNRLFVQCQDSTLEILQLKPSGKSIMDGSAFINGFHPQSGEIFGAGSPTHKESR